MSETFDFVVVGSGGGSMCAALLMRAAGKSVLILEKADLVGGTTATSGGVMWIPNNRFMRSEGIDDSPEKALSYLDAIVGDDMAGATRERRRTYVEEATKMLDFLASQGIRLRRFPSWPDYYKAPGESVPGRAVVAELFDVNQLGEWKAKLRPGFLPLPANLDEAMQLPLFKRTWAAKRVLFRVIGRALADKLTGKQRATAGQALQGQMLHAALRSGTEIRVNARVKQLVVEGGRVTAVVAAKDGIEQRIEARMGVLINAGGFARNQRMLDQYIPGTSAEWSNVITEDTGDMIEEGVRIGAAIAQMSERIGMHIVLPPGNPRIKPTMTNDSSKPHSITVDQTGVRYMNEAGPSVEFCRKMRERDQQVAAVPSWLVLDSQYLRTYMLAGTMPGSRKPQAWFEQKFLRQGNTLEELAAACGMDAAKLRASVERFNGFVRAGRDEDFHRGEHVYEQWLGDPLRESSKTLGALEQGPFYALQLYPGDVSTFGGLVTDQHARVLRPDGSAIEGLYATGTSTASVMGKVEPGAGGSVGPSFTWGYVAAKHALQASERTPRDTYLEDEYMMLPEAKLYIDGVVRRAAGDKTYDNIGPWTGEAVGKAADASKEDVNAAIVAARKAFDHSDWSRNHAFRFDLMKKYRELLYANRPKLVDISRYEAGAAIGAAARAQVDGALSGMDGLLECFASVKWEEDRGIRSAHGFDTHRVVTHEAVGVVGAITPWNVPLYVNIGKVIAALLAGCTVILKPAPDTPLMGAFMGELAQQAGFPPGVFNVVTSADPVMAGEMLVADPRVDLISFTGSTAVGRRIMEKGAATLKRVFLELGGKSANVILDDAANFAQTVMSGMVVFHAGQGCAYPTRMLVPRSRYQEAVKALEMGYAGFATKWGDFNEPTCIMGPVISKRQLDRVMSYVEIGKKEGARLLAGGNVRTDKGGGFFIEPTCFVDVRNDMRIAQEEIFGPVLVVIPFEDDEDAIRIANESAYGLGGAVFSGDKDRALRVAKRIRAGSISVNGGMSITGDLPFGGYKASGVGREWGREGIEEFLETKAIGMRA